MELGGIFGQRRRMPLRVEKNLANNGTATIVPPQNLGAEESVLGAMMVSESTIEPVLLDVRLQAEDFYRDRHRTIYEAIIRLNEDANPVDVLTVSEALPSRRLDGSAAGTWSPAWRQGFPPRGAPSTTPRSSSRTRSAPPRRGGERSSNRSPSATASPPSSSSRPSGSSSRSPTRTRRGLPGARRDPPRRDRQARGLSKGTAEVTGTPSGFRDLDEKNRRLPARRPDHHRARPAIGKSTLICNFAENVALKAKKPVALFSLEMSEMELAHRFIGSQSRISSDRLRKGKVSSKDWPKVVKACNVLESAPLWIDDSSDLGLPGAAGQGETPSPRSGDAATKGSRW